MDKYLIILNPVADKGGAEKAIPAIEALFKSNNMDYEIVRTEYPGHGIELAKKAAGNDYDVVIAAGGDGTANEVINGLMLAREKNKKLPKFGVLPVGRGNDFSYGMGIPTDLDVVVKLIVGGHTKAIDIGQVIGGDYPKGRYFGNGIGIGFDTIVGFEAAKLPAFLSGIPAYLIAAIKTIFLYFDAPLLKIKMDDAEIEQACIMVSVMNGRRMGGSFMMAPESKPDDGLFSMCIVEQTTRMGIVKLFPKVMAGTQAGHPLVKTPLSSKLEITALEGSLPVHADGETICEKGEKLIVKIFPRQIEIICGV